MVTGAIAIANVWRYNSHFTLINAYHSDFAALKAVSGSHEQLLKGHLIK